jgi:hypothetical protein
VNKYTCEDMERLADMARQVAQQINRRTFCSNPAGNCLRKEVKRVEAFRGEGLEAVNHRSLCPNCYLTWLTTEAADVLHRAAGRAFTEWFANQEQNSAFDDDKSGSN